MNWPRFFYWIFTWLLLGFSLGHCLTLSEDSKFIDINSYANFAILCSKTMWKIQSLLTKSEEKHLAYSMGKHSHIMCSMGFASKYGVMPWKILACLAWALVLLHHLQCRDNTIVPYQPVANTWMALKFK